MTGGNEDRVRASSPWRRMVLISPSWWPPLSPAVMAAETVARAVGLVQVVAVAEEEAEETLDVAAAAVVAVAETAGEAVVSAECVNLEVQEEWLHTSGEAWRMREPHTRPTLLVEDNARYEMHSGQTLPGKRLFRLTDIYMYSPRSRYLPIYSMRNADYFRESTPFNTLT